MKALKITMLVVVLIVLVLAGFVLKTFHDAGEFKKLTPMFAGQCTSISGVLSSEDITIDPQTGVAFISSDDRRPLFHGKRGRQGAIHAYDLREKQPQLVNLTGDFPYEFHPHGIGLLVRQEGSPVLFVVNHRKDGHFVEIFDYEGNKLVYRESVGGELMHSPNDVIPVGSRSFYVTNDHGNSSKLGRTLEEYLQLAKSYVLYYDGKSFRRVAEGLAYANGINKSHDGKTIYVAATVGGKIYLYDRDVDSGALRPSGDIDLETGVDNIEVDEEGNLWVGAHPKLLTFVKYSKDPRQLSPSQVLKISIRGETNYSIDEIYLGLGDVISGSSVAAVFRDNLLIGSVFDNHFLSCKLP